MHIWSFICVFIWAPYCIYHIVDEIDYQIYSNRAVRWDANDRDYNDYVKGGCKIIGHFILWCIIWVLGSAFAIVFCEVHDLTFKN